MIQETGPDRGTVSYRFDLNNNLTGLTDARGVTRSYTYDALDRLTGIAYPDGAEDVSLSYDTCAHGSGRLCAITDHSGSTGYTYDAYGNLTAGVCQRSCPLNHAARRLVSASALGDSRSGLSRTVPMGVQLRTARPRQRSGCLALASS